MGPLDVFFRIIGILVKASYILFSQFTTIQFALNGIPQGSIFALSPPQLIPIEYIPIKLEFFIG